MFSEIIRKLPDTDINISINNQNFLEIECEGSLYKLSTIGPISSYFIINPFIILVSIICMYAFNLIIGLLPVFNTIKHKPAEILARHDLD